MMESCLSIYEARNSLRIDWNTSKTEHSNGGARVLIIIAEQYVNHHSIFERNCLQM